MAFFESVSSTGKYFGNDDSDKCVEYLQLRAAAWFNYYVENNYIYKLKRSWEAYHGSYYLDGHKITYGGEQGELVNLPINHYRNIATAMLNMVTSNRPVFQARATNLDSKSEVQVQLASGLLEYYLREKKLERLLKKAVEYAIVLGAGYIKLNWNSTAGKIYDYIDPEKVFDESTGEYKIPIDPATGEEAKPIPIYEGDVSFVNLSPFDIIFDTSKETYEETEWVLVRTFKNKYALAEKYPEFRDKILNIKTKTDIDSRRFFIHPYDESVDIPFYEFMHIKNEAIPNGRYLVYLDSDIILSDTALPFKDLPVYRVTPADFLGTPFGYTPMFDLIPIQTAINSLHSTILTNQNAFGVQNVLNPRGNDVRVQQIEGGLNFIEYNGQVGKPEALNLTNTPPEIFNYLSMLEREMETISGINSVARGNPPGDQVRSGNALALLQAQALQFISGLQQGYIQMVEDVGTGLINALKDFASVPRIAAIVGTSNKTKMQEFTGDDLDTVNRIIVDVGNALSQSTAGRVQMAEQMLQMKIIDSPEKYLEVMNTGKLTAMTDGQTNELLLIKAENEQLLDGKIEVAAIATDRHSLHIREHRTVLADPKLRMQDPQLVQRVSGHIQEHIQLLQNTDPNILALIGEQPLSPPGGQSVSPNTAAPNTPSQSSMGNVPEQMAVPEAAGVGPMAQPAPGQAAPGSQLPQPAQPAQIKG